ncbi:hypothetical protein [Pseudoblastomonas halimionae]|uniref:Uncharacterized protein n=1 Tax=Alteriqipengyuania halimionae TaxID=1926630 RepID=A0A6I4U4V9_9SPHN|nr:hypothetical protein [Alteriqipengyuania halimionae]MXP09267.1 hypothetical protein [Alteriqipengyuania halimionae]
MIRIAFPLAAVAALALSACSDGPDTVEGSDETDLDNVDTVSEAEAEKEALPADDFADLELGAKIDGPQGTEVKTTLSNQAGNFADITSYVSCPDGLDPCDPREAPEGTVFTYVHVVYPGEDMDPTTGAGEGVSSSDVERATMFRMTRPARGFTGKAGFSKGEVEAAIGTKADVVITCNDGALVWTVSAGDGGDQWQAREPITFWWQSTLPPVGPADAYEIEVDGTLASGNGPYPGKSDSAAQGCAG